LVGVYHSVNVIITLFTYHTYNIFGRNYRVLSNILTHFLTTFYHKSHAQSVCKQNILTM